MGPIEPFRFEVDESEQVFHARVHFPDTHIWEMVVAGADKPGAELRVRDAFTGPTLRAVADEWGEPEHVEVSTPEEYIRLDADDDPA
jgi:hypothetical protein